MYSGGKIFLLPVSTVFSKGNLPQKCWWHFFITALSSGSKSTYHRCISKQSRSTRELWTPGGLWSCPQLTSVPLMSLHLLLPSLHWSWGRTRGQDGKMMVSHHSANTFKPTVWCTTYFLPNLPIGLKAEWKYFTFLETVLNKLNCVMSTVPCSNFLPKV